MMKWSHTLIAAGALILLTNAVALLGAAYNRSDDPESQLQLTQRELQHSTWHSGKDNSGITLSLSWRFEQTRKDDFCTGYYLGMWGTPVWLDKAKMAELGFDVDRLAATSEYGRRNKEVQPREALLVLELNDRVYQRQLLDTKECVEQARKLLKAAPNSEELKRKAKSAEESYKNEQQTNSRLFVIDAGLDAQKLRARYPDRARYAIVHGVVRPHTEWEKGVTRIGGNISELHAERINVPLTYRQVFNDSKPYEVTVAFGKRLEPWIIRASRTAAAN
jgi:hypothetical protein